MKAHRIAHRCGAVVQGLILGGLLMLALIKLIELATNAHLFRYQGF